MTKNIEVFDGQWYIKYVPSEEAAFIKTHEDVRFRTKNGYLTERVEGIQPQPLKSYQGCILITFEAPNAPGGRKSVRFDVAKLVLEKTSFRDLLSPLVMSTKQFCAAFTANVLKPAGGQGTEAAQEKEYEMPWTSDPMPNASQAPAKKKRVSAGGKRTDPVDLPSPSKQPKAKATTIDERIDSRYIGHLSVTLDSLSSDCPKAWLDREINPDHVKEVERALEKTPTIAKTMQSWIAIVDIDKKDLTSKEMIKGCRITVIGGRHRHAAYKKVCQVSEVHERELRKVWVHLYDNQLSDQEIRRLAATHNTINVGSMVTPWLTRVHSCREWLYKSAGKSMEDDETPPSTQAWKTACQMMYVSKDKDANTLEPTLQAALLRRDVYEQLCCVGELYLRSELKDQQGATKRKRSAKTGEGITQSKLGMPLQGLTDETKLDLLKQVSKKEISLGEFKDKSQRIKKKQIIVNSFIKYAGEESYETLRARFPLHATEEKLAQFVNTNITKKSIPQEIIAFFERAIKWESEKVSDTLNLHEERDGVYFFQRGESSAILLEGSLSNIPIKQVRRLITARPFKGFSLVLASLPKETNKKDLALFITNVHAANVDLLHNYNVAIITDEENVEMCREHLKHRLTQQQNAYWVNTKPQKLQGYMLKNNIRPIVFGHWAKEGAMTDSHCHFDDNESAVNTFCFEEKDAGHLPKSLLKHIVNHFSYKGQWILDLTASKDSGIVAALASGRNCVSLMNLSDLRKTAEAAASTVNREDDVTENDSDNNQE